MTDEDDGVEYGRYHLRANGEQEWVPATFQRRGQRGTGAGTGEGASGAATDRADSTRRADLEDQFDKDWEVEHKPTDFDKKFPRGTAEQNAAREAEKDKLRTNWLRNRLPASARPGQQAAAPAANVQAAMREFHGAAELAIQMAQAQPDLAPSAGQIGVLAGHLMQMTSADHGPPPTGTPARAKYDDMAATLRRSMEALRPRPRPQQGQQQGQQGQQSGDPHGFPQASGLSGLGGGPQAAFDAYRRFQNWERFTNGLDRIGGWFR